MKSSEKKMNSNDDRIGLVYFILYLNIESDDCK